MTSLVEAVSTALYFRAPMTLMTVFRASLLLLTVCSVASAGSIFDFSVPAVAGCSFSEVAYAAADVGITLEAVYSQHDCGGEVHMSNFKGQRAYLLVNVASYCGLTNQNYAELQQLYEKYSSSGLEIIAFPCNDFGGQEPEHINEIVQFAKGKGATFSVLGKIGMNHPLYKFLQGLGQTVTWNFGKFLCNADGVPIMQYQPNQSPLSIERDIVELLRTSGAEL